VPWPVNAAHAAWPAQTAPTATSTTDAAFSAVTGVKRRECGAAMVTAPAQLRSACADVNQESTGHLESLL
jgi:hypothetical protein